MSRRIPYAIAAVLVISGLVHLTILLATHGSWSGPVSWRKPMTFGLSFGVTLATITWVISFLRLGTRLRMWLVVVFSAACVLEVALITVQAWRRTPSHFNFSSTFDTIVARSLAVGGVTLIVGIAILTVAAFRLPPEDPALRLALRAGFVILDVAIVSGAIMLVIGLRRVIGGDQQGAYATADSLKLLHGATMHAILVLPALARITRDVRAVRIAIVVYAAAASTALLV
ncbi:hypothetical protein [Winogradskya humida]|nr:hypothetical protein [Actinoplanes humidus]